jgi:hypothetical protein
MRRRIIVGIVIVGLVALVGIALVLLERTATPVSQVDTSDRPCIVAAESCLRFPVVTGENLPGQSFTLPADFTGESVLVIVPFDERQQVDALAWLPLARDLASTDSGFAYYNVPVFPSLSAPMRVLIRGGMVLTIGDEALRAVTITVFLEDLAPFLSDLNIPNTDAMQVFLLNGDGEVLWRGVGEYSAGQGDSLRAALSA